MTFMNKQKSMAKQVYQKQQKSVMLLKINNVAAWTVDSTRADIRKIFWIIF